MTSSPTADSGFTEAVQTREQIQEGATEILSTAPLHAQNSQLEPSTPPVPPLATFEGAEASTPLVPKMEDPAITPPTTGEVAHYTTPIASPIAAAIDKTDRSQAPPQSRVINDGR